MRTLRLTIAYDGTRYAGWQVQQSQGKGPGARGGGSSKPTIQGTLERAFAQIVREPVRIVASGRTDAGVHALAQVAHVRTRTCLSTDRLVQAVNHLLPPNIAVLTISDAAPAFHARFNAIAKRYRYRIFTGPVVSPFVALYVYQVRWPLNLGLMRREAAVLVGRHDVRAFARAGGQGSTTRRLFAAQVRRVGPEIHLELTGDGFLHMMMRSIAGTLIDIGRGRLEPGRVRRLLRTGDRRLVGFTAPARGLTLLSVSYPARIRDQSRAN